MIKNIFKKFKNNFSNKFNLNNENYSKTHKLEKEKSKTKFKILEIDGNHYDVNSLDKESKIIVELYEISKLKIEFFENLIKQLKVDKKFKIIELKSKLDKENSLT